MSTVTHNDQRSGAESVDTDQPFNLTVEERRQMRLRDCFSILSADRSKECLQRTCELSLLLNSSIDYSWVQPITEDLSRWSGMYWLDGDFLAKLATCDLDELTAELLLRMDKLHRNAATQCESVALVQALNLGRHEYGSNPHTEGNVESRKWLVGILTDAYEDLYVAGNNPLAITPDVPEGFVGLSEKISEVFEKAGQNPRGYFANPQVQRTFTTMMLDNLQGNWHMIVEAED
jgi:hypothetical protein